jgi:kynurenine formamidase
MAAPRRTLKPLKSGAAWSSGRAARILRTSSRRNHRVRTVEPATGLEFVELSHPWGHHTPTYPGFDDVSIHRTVTHAAQGVMSQRVKMTMHSGTHLNAPIHLIQGGRGVGDLDLERFFGPGVVLDIPKNKWEVITADDLDRTSQDVHPNDIVIIDSGWHRRYSDSIEYFGYSPGLDASAAAWLVARHVKLVGVDTPNVDHPLATSLGPHRNGPLIRRLAPEYAEATGREALRDFPDWNIAHKTLLAEGIATIENVGGDLDEVSGRRCTFHAYPWRWPEGDACIIRLVAILDPHGQYRVEPGYRQAASAKSPPQRRAGSGRPRVDAPISTKQLQFHDLSQRWGHGMPEWPSSLGLKVDPLQFHAKDGVRTVEIDAIMHRGTHMDAPIHVTENAPYLNDYDVWRFFGTGVAVSIPKGKWGVITPDDFENAEPRIQEGDIVMINTGSHHNWGDNDKYFAYSPGLYKAGAEWLVDKRIKLLGIDVQALDHPLGTKMVAHGPGPSHPHLIDEYRAETGRDVMTDFPYWEPAHKTLMVKGGIPGIESIGGDLDKVTGHRCTFMAFPWRWTHGDGSGVRVIAVIDPDQSFRFETGR